MQLDLFPWLSSSKQTYFNTENTKIQMRRLAMEMRHPTQVTCFRMLRSNSVKVLQKKGTGYKTLSSHVQRHLSKIDRLVIFAEIAPEFNGIFKYTQHDIV